MMWPAVLVVLLACMQHAQAAALNNVSRAQFQTLVLHLQDVVAACESSAAACNSDGVGADVRVDGNTAYGFEEHWQWLRSALEQAQTAKGNDRTALLRNAHEHLAALAEDSSAAPGPYQRTEYERAQTAANEILRRSEFQRGGGPTWWDHAKAWMVEWIQRLFVGVAQVGAAAPWLGTLLEWLFFVGAAAALLFLMLRNSRRQRLRLALGGAKLQNATDERAAEDWSLRAEEYAAQQQWRDAVHCVYWAAIASLESQRAWRHDPARTPREYLHLLKQGSAQRTALRDLTQIFERSWYGRSETNQSAYLTAYQTAHARFQALLALRDGSQQAGGPSGPVAASGRAI